MDLIVLKRKISTYRSEGGKLRTIPDELLGEILSAWEHWTGPASGFYEALGVDFRKMAAFIGRAKKLKQEGRFPEESFKEIKIESASASNQNASLGPCQGAELVWSDGKIIRFSNADLLLDFLKKAA